MIIKFKDPNRRIHGKLHKHDSYYFRVHYGEQRLVYISKPYIDQPSENQIASRQAFTALRKEVARQLHDPRLKAAWEQRFKADPQGYKMLHTYVYAMMKRGESVTQSPTYRDAILWLHASCCISPNNPTGVPDKQLTLPMLGNKGDAQKGVSTSHYRVERRNTITSLHQGGESVIIVVYDGAIMPLFLPSKVPRERDVLCCCT